MRKLLPILVGILVLGTACGDGGEEAGIGQSGEPPDTRAEETTTTTAAVATTTTLPLAVGEIPDVSDLGLEWDEEVVVDEATGLVERAGFNRYLLGEPTEDDPECTAPDAMLDPEVLEGLDPEEADAVRDVALGEAPAKAVALFLGLSPGDPSVQMLAGPAGGPEASRIVVIRQEEDDSIRATRFELIVEMQSCGSFVSVAEQTTTTEAAAPDSTEAPTTTTAPEAVPAQLVPILSSASWSVQCQPGRGHQDFTLGSCT